MTKTWLKYIRGYQPVCWLSFVIAYNESGYDAPDHGLPRLAELVRARAGLDIGMHGE